MMTEPGHQNNPYEDDGQPFDLIELTDRQLIGRFIFVVCLAVAVGMFVAWAA